MKSKRKMRQLQGTRNVKVLNVFDNANFYFCKFSGTYQTNRKLALKSPTHALPTVRNGRKDV